MNGKPNARGRIPNAFWLCEETGHPVSSSACVECARARLVPECRWSSPGVLVRLAKELSRTPDVSSTDVRVSMLAQCPLKSWHTYRDTTIHLEKPSEHWARLRGTMFHEGFEHGFEGEEVRLYWDVALPDGSGSVRLAGRYDYYDVEYRTLHDYKTANKLGPTIRLPKKNNVIQMGLYVWLLGKHGYAVDRVNLTYLSMDRVQTVWLEGSDIPRYTDDEVSHMVWKVVRDTPPEAKPLGDWECRYCHYRDSCAYYARRNIKFV